MIIRMHMLAFVGGFLLDCLLGDPYSFPHPVKAIGSFISFLDLRFMGEKQCDEEKKAGEAENAALNTHRKKTEFHKGIFLAAAVLFCTAAVTALILITAYCIHPVIGCAAELVMTYQILAARCLQTESRKVYCRLKAHDLEGARRAVSMIVGRDTDILDEEGVARAAVETVAESTCDGVIAPMFYTALGGPVLGMLYKAVNTLDSMVGYKSRRYLYFGRAAAKLDDFANLLPSRISAVLLIAGAAVLGRSFSAKNALKIWRRDARKHASPNAGQTEAACAGALGVQLAGDTIYAGRVVKKPFIGERTRPVTPEDITDCNKLMYAAAVICLLCCTLLMAAADKF